MFSFIGFNHFTILVNDKERAETFYTEVLGFEKIQVGGKYHWLKVGSQFIHLSQELESTIPVSFCHFAVNVVGFKEYLTYLMNNNVQVFDLDENKNKIVINQNKVLGHFFVNDTEGNLVEFVDIDSKFFNPK